MKRTCLLLSVLLLFAIPSCFSECFIETVKGVPSYQCNTVQEFEQQGNPNAFDVYINKPNDAGKKKLNIKLVLIDDGSNGLSPNTFQLLKELGNLFKPGVEIGILPRGLFENLPLQELKLHNNGINTIEVGTFSSLRYLKILYIVDNKLTIVKNGIYNNLPLETLALSRNRISFIERDAFKNLAHLKQLHLDGNRLAEFQSEIIINIPGTLEELYLQKNLLTDIDRNTVRGFGNLKRLDLSHNKISHCASYTFDEVSNIEDLNLGNNLLTDFKSESFPSNGLQKLQKLYIQNNRLSYLTTVTLERLRRLKGIRMGGNPWQCPCLEAILTWLSDHNVEQKCDQDYYNGTRPVCVVDDIHPTRCIYEVDGSYYQMYSKINNRAPQSPDCIL